MLDGGTTAVDDRAFAWPEWLRWAWERLWVPFIAFFGAQLTSYLGALGAGYFLVAAVGGGNPVWWPVGVILAGAVAPWAGAVLPRDDHRD